MVKQTIDDLVDLFHPTHVSVNNPKEKGIPTKGDAIVSRFEVEYDDADNAILMWVDIE